MLETHSSKNISHNAHSVFISIEPRGEKTCLRDAPTAEDIGKALPLLGTIETINISLMERQDSWIPYTDSKISYQIEQADQNLCWLPMF